MSKSHGSEGVKPKGPKMREMRTTVGACTVDALLRACPDFDGSDVRNRPQPTLQGAVCLHRRRPPYMGNPCRRYLINPRTAKLTDDWDQLGVKVEVTTEYTSNDGETVTRTEDWYWFSVSDQYGFLWISRSRAAIMAIPVPDENGRVIGYILLLTTPRGRFSKYGLVMMRQGVQWRPDMLDMLPDESLYPGSEQWRQALSKLYDELMRTT